MPCAVHIGVGNTRIVKQVGVEKAGLGFRPAPKPERGSRRLSFLPNQSACWQPKPVAYEAFAANVRASDVTGSRVMLTEPMFYTGCDRSNCSP